MYESFFGLIALEYGLVSFGNLMAWICLAFGLDFRKQSAAELNELFVGFLAREHAARPSVSHRRH